MDSQKVNPAKNDSQGEEEVLSNSSNNSNELELPPEILEAIPEEDRNKVAGMVRSFMFQGMMRRSSPIGEKVTSEHITQLITNSDEQDKRDREERKSQRNYNLLILLIALVFVGFLVVFLRSCLN